MKNTNFFSSIAFVLLFCLLTASLGFAQGPGISLNYTQLRPTGDLGKHMAPNHGLTYNFNYKFTSRFRLGFTIGFGSSPALLFDSYPLQGLELQPGNHSIKTSNFTFNYFVVPRFYLLNKGWFKPFVNAKLGQMNFANEISIEENTRLEDEKFRVECPDAHINLSDAPFVVGLGVGVELDIVEDIFSFVIEVNHLRGGNIRHLTISPPANIDSRTLRTTGGSSPEHFTANIESTRLNLLDIRLGLLLTLPWD